MKKIYSLLFIAAFFACSGPKNDSHSMGEFGEIIDTSGAISVPELQLSALENNPQSVTLKGIVAEVCQSEGCWLTLENGKDKPLLVRMKNHDFKVPKDISGQMIYLKGDAVLETISVETLKDYASDAGKSEIEIQAIDKPETEVVVEAIGIKILKSDAPK